jgi:hypothetical protein
MKKPTCKIKITDAMDAKAFPQLMNKHNLTIVKQEDKRNQRIFTVQGSSEDIEEIMVYSSLHWSFA